MGRKAKSKLQPPSARPPVNEAAANAEFESSGYAEIKKECEKVIAQIDKKNFTKAHGILKKLFSTRGGEERVPRLSAALIHRIQASIWWKETSNMDSRKEKLRCWRNTVEAAKRATELSPNSIEFAHYYALSVYDMEMGEGEGNVEEVIRECNRALNIENPIDPLMEGWFSVSQNTREKRIDDVRKWLRRLLQKAHSCRMSSKSDEIEEAPETPKDRREGIKGTGRIVAKMQELKNPEVEKGNEKRAERRKFGIDARKFEEMNRFRDFWYSMSRETKREGFLRIRVSDLKGYFESGDKNTFDVLNEALGFVEEKRGWRFWTCCECREKFEDEKSFEKHCVNHFWRLIPRLEEVVPVFRRNDYLEKMVCCSWKPVDVSSAVELLDDCCKDSDISTEEEPVVCSNHSWPECKDNERGPILDEIEYLLMTLIEYECLADQHINVLEHFTLKGLENLASGSHLLKHGLDKTPVGICFLEASQLRMILNFLRTIINFSESVKFPDDGSIANQQDEVEEKIVLSDDASWLCLDENLLPLDCAADATAAADANADKLLSWIFSGPLSKDQVRSWTRKKEEKVQQGAEIFQSFQNLFKSSENLCEHKCEHADALEAMEDICVGEGKRMENGIEGYTSLFEKRVEEILKNTELMIIHKAISHAKALIVNQLSALESGEDDSRSEDYWLKVDTCIEEGFQSLRSLLDTELNKLDAQIMLNKAELRKLKSKLNLVSANDYRLILSSLVKSYLRARLEALGREKSHAASEALLAELQLDSEKQEEAKVKKKTKKEKRDKKLKASISKEHHLPGNVAYEEASPSSVTADGDHLDSDNLQSANEDALKLREEELQWKTELEAEEKKLEEALEDQRRIENETKVKKSELLNQAEEMDVEPGKESQGLPHGKKTQDHSPDESGSSEGENQSPEKERMQVGVGLRNNCGEHNCFLNVIIQSLWHLRTFRDEFLKRIEHVHVGAPCVICALRDIFTELRAASSSLCREVVAPTALRKALSELPTTKEFEEGKMSDAAEAFVEILNCLHDSASTPGSESVGNKDKGIWDCTSNECIAHSVFGLNKPRCHQCDQKSGYLNTSFNYQIAASFFQTKKVMHADSTFDKLLDLIKNEQSSCNHIDHSISNPPPVFATVLEWESRAEMAEYIAATLGALSTEIDLSLIYRGIGFQHKHKLISMVNYHSWKHYCCFIYSRELERWVRYNDENIEVIGCWTDVLTMCEMECFQPRILFFEDAHIEDANEKSDAAIEAIPAQELGSKRGVQRGKNNLKSSQEKARVKKKTRKEKRDKKPKAIIPKKHHLLGNQAHKQASRCIATDSGDHLDPDNLQSMNEDPLKLEEEELQRKAEPEAEETMLEQALEDQRRIDTETKVKHLAQPLSEQVQNVSLDFGEREPLVEKSGILNQPEEMNIEPGMESQVLSWEESEHIWANQTSTDNVDGGYVYGTGLKNDGAENNCFLNVLIQSLSESLWHLRRFQDEFLKRTEHVHIGAPCVVCGLRDIFTELRTTSTSVRKEAVAPTTFEKKTRWEERDENIKAIIPKKCRLVWVRKEAPPSFTTDGDHLDCDILQVPAVKEDLLKLQKEEFRRKTELRAEKTKLKEAPECQRVIEHEDKVKQLAVQQHEASKTLLPKTISGQVQNVNPDFSEHEPLVNKSWFLDQPEGMHMESGQKIQDWRSEHKPYLKIGNIVILTNESSTDSADGGEVHHRTGAKNDTNECGCFLRVIIQSLWHLSLFREKFLRRYTSEHVHEGDPCVVCALHDLFVELSIASTTMHRKAKAIATTSLRVAISELARQKAISELAQQEGISESYRQKRLSELDQQNNFFPKGQMCNAFEVLKVIFDCLRRASTPGVALSQQVQKSDPGPWDSSLFRMDVIAQMDCRECKRETEDQKYTWYLHYTHAKTLLRMKVAHTQSAFDDLLRLVLIRLYPCLICAKQNHIYYIMSIPPRVFTTVVDWEDASDSGDDITPLLIAMSTEIDLSVLYRGLAPNHKHNLVSMVCYCSGHYHCFVYSHEDDLWLMYDHLAKKEIGSWTDVLNMCIRECLQPQVLFFLAAEFVFQDKQ